MSTWARAINLGDGGLQPALVRSAAGGVVGGGLGRVLGQVAGDLMSGQRLPFRMTRAVVAANDPDVELPPEGEPAGVSPASTAGASSRTW